MFMKPRNRALIPSMPAADASRTFSASIPATAQTVYYVRRGDGPRVRVYGEYGSREFMAAYNAALAGNAAPQRKAAAPTGTLGWLISAYHGSPAWARLSVATRRQREGVFRSIETADIPLAEVTPQAVRAGMARRKPCAAEAFLICMKVLFRWALDHEHIEADPTAGLRTTRQKTDGFHTWTEAEIARFEARWPVGTRERLAMSILLYTGLRRGDACALGRQHIRHGVITVRTEKTGQQVTISLLPELARIIEATPSRRRDLHSRQARPSNGEPFIRPVVRDGLQGGGSFKRKGARAAQGGGDAGGRERRNGRATGKHFRLARRPDGTLYTRQADRAKLARDAMEKLLTPHQV